MATSSSERSCPPIFDALPSHLRESILALLPLPYLLRLRLVNKQWRRLLSSPSFARSWTQSSARLPWFLIPHLLQHHAAYDFESARWFRLPVRFAATPPPAASPPCFRGGFFIDHRTHVSDPSSLAWMTAPTSCSTERLFCGMALYVDQTAGVFEMQVVGTLPGTGLQACAVGVAAAECGTTFTAAASNGPKLPIRLSASGCYAGGLPFRSTLSGEMLFERVNCLDGTVLAVDRQLSPRQIMYVWCPRQPESMAWAELYRTDDEFLYHYFRA